MVRVRIIIWCKVAWGIIWDTVWGGGRVRNFSEKVGGVKLKRKLGEIIRSPFLTASGSF